MNINLFSGTIIFKQYLHLNGINYKSVKKSHYNSNFSFFQDYKVRILCVCICVFGGGGNGFYFIPFVFLPDFFLENTLQLLLLLPLLLLPLLLMNYIKSSSLVKFTVPLRFYHEVCSIIMPILQMRELRLGQVQQIGQHHAVNKQQSQDQNNEYWQIMFQMTLKPFKSLRESLGHFSTLKFQFTHLKSAIDEL